MNERITNTREGDVISGREAADMLPGITYATLMRWAREGRVPSFQYLKGGKRLFLRSDIEALLSPDEFTSTSKELPIPGLGRVR